MTQLSFGIRIGAEDDTQGGLRAALAGISSFASVVAKPITIPLRFGRKGLALARDINLGLAPIIRGFDRIVSRGTGLEVVRKSFGSLIGKNEAQADRFARHLVRAAGGGIRTAKAMELANRAIASGINVVKDLPTILEFASKKAITTGMGFGTAMDRIIMGLSRGSAPILDDFGLLNDGLKGVGRAYDSIKGAGAWDDLGPAAQKAEIVRQAMQEIHGQLGRIGVTGKETAFVFQSIKSGIGDAVDKLFLAIGKSGELHAAMRGVSETISGMARHLKGGGGLGELLLGKEGGKSGGLFGFVKAGVNALGSMFGKGILSGLQREWPALKAKLHGLWAEAKPELLSLIDELKAGIREAVQPLTNVLGGLSGIFGGAAKSPTTQPATTQPATTQPATTQPATTQPALPQPGLLWPGVKAGISGAPGAIARTGALAMGAKAASTTLDLTSWQIAQMEAQAGLSSAAAARGALKFLAKGVLPAVVVGDFVLSLYQFGKALRGFLEARTELDDVNKTLQKQQRMLRNRKAVALNTYVPPPKQAGLFGANWASQWLQDFQEDFPPEDAQQGADASKYGLTGAGKRAVKREISRLKREAKLVQGGGRFVRQRALKLTGQEVDRLRRSGYRVGPRERREIFEQIYRQLVDELTRPLLKKIEELEERLRRTEERERINREEIKAKRDARRHRRGGGVADPDAPRVGPRQAGPAVGQAVAVGQGAGDAARGDAQLAKVAQASQETARGIEELVAMAQQAAGSLNAVADALVGAHQKLAGTGRVRP